MGFCHDRRDLARFGFRHGGEVSATFVRAPDSPPRFVDIVTPLHGPDGQSVGSVAAHLICAWIVEIERSMLGPPRERHAGVEGFILARDGAVQLRPPGSRGLSMAHQQGSAEPA